MCMLSGIGSVLSLHSVVIRPQIDGVLTKLLVKEGQLVKAGDLLATIDDRSIRASLDQAKAQLGESQAQGTAVDATSLVLAGRVKTQAARATITRAPTIKAVLR